ncbi:histone-lysine N-methyltransferase ash1-like isoform X1 [Uranotaenia lowii]|uniref:histone-lysine N-methyltransferase ash1-like isoform X1 n=1 Tax=Uranotaenia lowii TaxID=190385 RepID=UPI00247A17D0|nr:histone-lysine N-methyltransferase ash1-like isoform X1 [Uranotaenia lowii]
MTTVKTTPPVDSNPPGKSPLSSSSSSSSSSDSDDGSDTSSDSDSSSVASTSKTSSKQSSDKQQQQQQHHAASNQQQQQQQSQQQAQQQPQNPPHQLQQQFSVTSSDTAGLRMKISIPRNQSNSTPTPSPSGSNRPSSSTSVRAAVTSSPAPATPGSTASSSKPAIGGEQSASTPPAKGAAAKGKSDSSSESSSCLSNYSDSDSDSSSSDNRNSAGKKTSSSGSGHKKRKFVKRKKTNRCGSTSSSSGSDDSSDSDSSSDDNQDDSKDVSQESQGPSTCGSVPLSTSTPAKPSVGAGAMLANQTTPDADGGSSSDNELPALVNAAIMRVAESGSDNDSYQGTTSSAMPLYTSCLLRDFVAKTTMLGNSTNAQPQHASTSLSNTQCDLNRIKTEASMAGGSGSSINGVALARTDPSMIVPIKRRGRPPKTSSIAPVAMTIVSKGAVKAHPHTISESPDSGILSTHSSTGSPKTEKKQPIACSSSSSSSQKRKGEVEPVSSGSSKASIVAPLTKYTIASLDRNTYATERVLYPPRGKKKASKPAKEKPLPPEDNLDPVWKKIDISKKFNEPNLSGYKSDGGQTICCSKQLASQSGYISDYGGARRRRLSGYKSDCSTKSRKSCGYKSDYSVKAKSCGYRSDCSTRHRKQVRRKRRKKIVPNNNNMNNKNFNKSASVSEQDILQLAGLTLGSTSEESSSTEESESSVNDNNSSVPLSKPLQTTPEPIVSNKEKSIKMLLTPKNKVDPLLPINNFKGIFQSIHRFGSFDTFASNISPKNSFASFLKSNRNKDNGKMTVKKLPLSKANVIKNSEECSKRFQRSTSQDLLSRITNADIPKASPAKSVCSKRSRRKSCASDKLDNVSVKSYGTTIRNRRMSTMSRCSSRSAGSRHPWRKRKRKRLRSNSVAKSSSDIKLSMELERLSESFNSLCRICPAKDTLLGIGAAALAGAAAAKSMQKGRSMKKRKASEHVESPSTAASGTKRRNKKSVTTQSPDDHKLPLKKRHYLLSEQTPKERDTEKEETRSQTVINPCAASGSRTNVASTITSTFSSTSTIKDPTKAITPKKRHLLKSDPVIPEDIVQIKSSDSPLTIDARNADLTALDTAASGHKKSDALTRKKNRLEGLVSKIQPTATVAAILADNNILAAATHRSTPPSRPSVIHSSASNTQTTTAISTSSLNAPPPGVFEPTVDLELSIPASIPSLIAKVEMLDSPQLKDGISKLDGDDSSKKSSEKVIEKLLTKTGAHLLLKKKRKKINRTGFPTVKKKKKKLVERDPAEGDVKAELGPDLFDSSNLTRHVPSETEKSTKAKQKDTHVNCDRVPKEGEPTDSFIERNTRPRLSVVSLERLQGKLPLNGREVVSPITPPATGAGRRRKSVSQNLANALSDTEGSFDRRQLRGKSKDKSELEKRDESLSKGKEKKSSSSSKSLKKENLEKQAKVKEVQPVCQDEVDKFKTREPTKKDMTERIFKRKEHLHQRKEPVEQSMPKKESLDKASSEKHSKAKEVQHPKKDKSAKSSEVIQHVEESTLEKSQVVNETQPTKKDVGSKQSKVKGIPPPKVDESEKHSRVKDILPINKESLEKKSRTREPLPSVVPEPVQNTIEVTKSSKANKVEKESTKIPPVTVKKPKTVVEEVKPLPLRRTRSSSIALDPSELAKRNATQEQEIVLKNAVIKILPCSITQDDSDSLDSMPLLKRLQSRSVSRQQLAAAAASEAMETTPTPVSPKTPTSRARGRPKGGEPDIPAPIPVTPTLAEKLSKLRRSRMSVIDTSSRRSLQNSLSPEPQPVKETRSAAARKSFSNDPVPEPSLYDIPPVKIIITKKDQKAAVASTVERKPRESDKSNVLNSSLETAIRERTKSRCSSRLDSVVDRLRREQKKVEDPAPPMASPLQKLKRGKSDDFKVDAEKVVKKMRRDTAEAISQEVVVPLVRVDLQQYDMEESVTPLENLPSASSSMEEDLEHDPLPAEEGPPDYFREETPSPPVDGKNKKVPRKKYITAGLFSDCYKDDGKGAGRSGPKVQPETLLPPPAYCEKFLRRTQRDFQLPFDLWWAFENRKLTNRHTVASWNYKKIRTNVYYDVKANPSTDHPQCNCKPQTGCIEDCLNRMVYVECDPENCPCGDRCRNTKIQRHEYAPGLERFMTEKKGWGIRSKEGIKKGMFIMEYLGEVVTDKEFKERMRTIYLNDMHHYCLNLTGGLVIDGHRMGSDCRFVNHSCAPNCEMQKWSVNGLFRMALFAARDIPAYEELSYDYNFSLFNPSEGQPCMCGSDKCRGVIGGKYQRVKPLPVATEMKKPLEAVEAEKTVSTTAAPTDQSPRSAARSRKRQAKKNAPITQLNGQPLPNFVPPTQKERSLIIEHHCFLLRNLNRIRKKDRSPEHLSASQTASPALGSGQNAQQGVGGKPSLASQISALRCPRNIRTRGLAFVEDDPELEKIARIAVALKEICLEIASLKDERGHLYLNLLTLPSKKKNPLYYERIPRPIDLAQLQSNIEQGSYKQPKAFEDDLLIMFSNAVKFFGISSPEGVASEKLKEHYFICKQRQVERLIAYVGEQNELLRGFIPKTEPEPVAPVKGRGKFKQEQAEDIIRCICGLFKDEGMMIQCSKCLVWQHVECTKADPAIENYLCERCEPRTVDPEIPLNDYTDEGYQYYISLMRGNLQIRQTDTVYVLRDIPMSPDPDNPNGPHRKHTYKTIGNIDYAECDIFRVESLWKDKEGRRFVYGHHYLRPHETFHEPTRRFYPNEVMRVPLYEVIPIELVMARCWVLDPATFCKGRPVDSSEPHVYICELRVDKSARLFSKIKHAHPICMKSYAFHKFEQKLKISKTFAPHDLGSLAHLLTAKDNRKKNSKKDDSTSTVSGASGSSGSKKMTPIIQLLPPPPKIDPTINTTTSTSSATTTTSTTINRSEGATLLPSNETLAEKRNRLEQVLARLMIKMTLNPAALPAVDISYLLTGRGARSRRTIANATPVPAI